MSSPEPRPSTTHVQERGLPSLALSVFLAALMIAILWAVSTTLAWPTAPSNRCATVADRDPGRGSVASPSPAFSRHTRADRSDCAEPR